jgi:lysophospholipase L1-like esterase
MLSLLMMSFLACSNSDSESKTQMGNTKRPLKYLALGDSYTIGEGVPKQDRFPNQLVKRLKDELNLNINQPVIIAKTGWTVDELQKAIDRSRSITPPYDLVTLLIGVNNQYRGKALEEYKIEFEKMLLQSIGFAGNLPNHVIVLSIPNWGVTPFAVEKKSDQLKVANEIDAFNLAKKEICKQYGVFFIDITEHYRLVGGRPDMVVEDKLHPSSVIYTFWAEKLFDQVRTLYQKS